MAKKRKGWKVFVKWQTDPCDVSDGVCILRPEIRIVGAFDVCFARLYAHVFSDKIFDLITKDLSSYLPAEEASSDQDASGKEVQQDV